MNTVRELLKKKGCHVWSVTKDTSVLDALNLMAEKNIGVVFVFDRGQLVGVFSERDYARNVISEGGCSKDALVNEHMSSPVLSVKVEQTLSECMAIMTEKRARHLPVVDRENIVGVVSIGDVVSAVISSQEFLIDRLESYITGSERLVVSN